MGDCSISEWVDISGYEGVYQINRRGEIRSLPRTIFRTNGTTQFFKGKLLKPHLNSSGYPVLRLSDSTHNNRKMVRVHRLVAETFIPNPDDKPEVNHIDGNKQNFSIYNLEWVTPRENRKHAWNAGLRNRSHLPIKCGEDKENSKLTNNIVFEMREMRKRNISFSKIAKVYGVHKTTAINAIKGVTWKHLLSPPTE